MAKPKTVWIDIGKVRLNINDDATEANKQPHFRGILPAQQKIEEGDEIFLAGWINKDRTEENITGLYFTLSMPEKEKQDPDLPF